MKRLLAATALSCFILALTGSAIAQTSNGQVGGVVQDPSKALIPGVSVTLRNVDTGVTTTQVTNESGAYNFASVPPGTYQVTGTLPGFKTSVTNGERGLFTGDVSGGTNSILSFENGTTGVFSSAITLNANAIIGLRDWYNNATVRGGTISGNIGGAGGLTVNSGSGSGGTLTLSGTNSYGGGTTITASTVKFTKLVAMPASGAVSVGATSTLAVNAGGTGEWTGGTGNGTIGGLFAGLGGQAGGTVSFTSGATLAVDTTNAGSTVTESSNLTGTGINLSKIGTGTLALSGTNTFTGATTLTAGTLSVADTSHLGGTTANNNIVFNGGTLQVTGTTMTSFGSHTRTYNANATAGFDINNAANNFNAGATAFVATTTLLKTGAGTLTLGAASNTIKTLQLNQGTLDIGSNNLAISNVGSTTINDASTSGTLLQMSRLPSPSKSMA